jgi:hypothetical protein
MTPFLKALGFLLGLTAVGCVAQAPPPEGRAPGPPPSRVARERVEVVECTPPHRLALLDLDMRPDPVGQGESIESWRLTVQSDRNGECRTRLEIRDQDQIVGLGEAHVIRPGRETYQVRAAPGYEFRRRDPCFVVQANVGGALTPLEAQRTFCARQRPSGGWSLRER